MRKRIWALLLTVALLLPVLPRISALGTVWFVAVNDTIPMTMTADSEPRRDGNGLYLPYSVFDARPGGVVPSYNQASQTFVLFTRSKRLVYDLALDTRTTEDGTQSAAQLYYRNGLLFVPSSSAEYFGLKVTLLTSKGGYSVLRFTDGTQSYSDEVFLEKAESLINYQAEHSYGGMINTDPVKEPQTDPSKETNEDRLSLVLCFYGNAVSRETEEALEKNGLHGAFFLTEDQIKSDPSLVRSLYARGHTVGLTVSEEESDVQEALARANEELDRVVFRKTFLAFLSKEQENGVVGFRVISNEERTPTADRTGMRAAFDEDVSPLIERVEAERMTVLQLRETSLVP